MQQFESHNPNSHDYISAIVDHNHIKPTLKIQKTVSLLKVYYLLCDEWTIANAYEEKQIVFTAIKKSMPKGKYFKIRPIVVHSFSIDTNWNLFPQKIRRAK